MSKDIIFSKVRKIHEDLPDIINTDTDNIRYEHVELKYAAPWMLEYGVIRDTEYETVDFFDAAEKEFGERPVSVSFQNHFVSNPAYRFVGKDGNVIGELSRKELDRYRYVKKVPACFFDRVVIGISSSAYIFGDVEDGIKTFEELLEMLRQVVEHDYPDAELLVLVAKALFEAKDAFEGEAVICEIN